MTNSTLSDGLFAGAPPLLVFLLGLSILSLPLLITVSALLRLRHPNPPRAAWTGTAAALLLVLAWLLPPGWLGVNEMKQLRDFVTIGLYAWVLLDWHRSVADAGWTVLDMVAVGLVGLITVLFLLTWVL